MSNEIYLSEAELAKLPENVQSALRGGYPIGKIPVNWEEAGLPKFADLSDMPDAHAYDPLYGY